MQENQSIQQAYFKKLIQLKIPILSGPASKNNQFILRSIALSGPMLKYRIFKDAKINIYSTASRRISNLVKRGYLAEAGKRITERGKQAEESMYGLSWKGFIASLTIKDVRQDIIRVLENNPLLNFPEKELILPIIKEMVTSEEIETLTNSFLRALVDSIPNLEIIDEKQIPFMIMSAFPRLNLPEGFKLSRIPKDAWSLLDRPTILRLLKETIVPFMKDYVENLKNLQLLISAFEGFDQLIDELETKDKPSEKIKEFVEKRVNTLQI